MQLTRLYLLELLLGAVCCNVLLDQIVKDFWEWRMRNNPEFASNIGDHNYTDQLEDYSLEAIDKRKTDMDAFMVRLRAVDRDSMSSADRVSYDVLKDTIQTWVEGYKWKDYGPMNPVQFLEGIQNNYGSRAGQVKLVQVEDFGKFSMRIWKYGFQINQIIERFNQAIKQNTTNNIKSVEKVPASLNAIYDKYINNITDFPMYVPFMAELDSTNASENIKSEIRTVAQNNTAYLLGRIKELSTFINTTYIPKTRTSFGVWGLPRGAEYYKACLKWQLSVDDTPDEIHDKGIREVNRVYAELQKIVTRAHFQGTVKEYNDLLRNNDSLFIKKADIALQMFRDMYTNRIVPTLDKMFKDIPDMPLKIEEMPYDGPSGIYKNGAPDGSRPGVFYANVKSKVPTFDVAALMLHEGDPGHHLQDSYALSATGVPMFRKVTDFSKYFAVPLHFPFYTAYSEGWGLYSEDLGEELDIFENDLERFGKFGLEIFRAARLVVDTGIHAKRWTRARAIEYMTNYTAYDLDFISREIDRYSTWPAQATSYMIGKLKIRELRDTATKRLCTHFNIKDFHNVILSNGAMPLNVLENVVNEWIEDVRENNNIDADCLNATAIEFWDWRMKNNPEFASNVGDSRYTELLEDYSITAIDNRKVDMEHFLKRLRGIERNRLLFADRVTYDVLNDTVNTWLDGYDWRFYGPMNPITFLGGLHTNYGSRAGQVKFVQEDDFRRFAIRIGKYGAQIEQIITRMEKAIEEMTTNHLVSIEKVPGQLDKIFAKYEHNNTAFPMYDPFRSKLDAIVTNTTTKQEIRNLAETNINKLLQKIQILSNFLKNTYMPNTRSSFGVWGLPRGAEYYKACLKWQLSVDDTPDEIHDKGIREVNRVYAELQNIVTNANFEGTVKNYNDFLRKNKSLFIDDEDTALKMFKDVYNDRIVPKLNLLFKDIPHKPLLIEKMPYDGANGIYKNGAPDGSRAGVFYANVNSNVSTFDMAALMLHETDPGHHLQDSYALTAQNMPMFRKATDFSKYFAVPLHFPFYTAYSEGWGLYSEDLGEDLDFFVNDLERFGKFGLEIFRAARLVVDTGIHSENKRWTRAQAIEYMTNYTAYSPTFIAKEIDRYSTWPGQATSYMIGKLKIQELRHIATTRLCNFNIKEFHNVLLSNGAMPLGVMGDTVEEWINEETVKNARAGTCMDDTSGSQHTNPLEMMICSSVIVVVCIFTGV